MLKPREFSDELPLLLLSVSMTTCEEKDSLYCALRVCYYNISLGDGDNSWVFVWTY